MPKNFFYSINLLIKSDSHLEKSITSIISDETFFLENIQLILIDTLCSELSLRFCAEYSKKYPENVFFVDASDKKEFDCYNDAKPLCTGTYITYIDNYSEYSKKTLVELKKILGSGKIPVLCIRPIVSPSGEEPREYRNDIPNGIVKLKETPDSFILMLGCYFFNKKTADKLLFDGSLPFHADVKFITEALLTTYSYVFTDSHTYTTTSPSEQEVFKYTPQYHRSFYSQTVDEFIIPMLISCPGSILAQNIMLYLLEMRFALNEGERYKYVIIGNFTDEFFDKVSKALKYIDDAVILNKKICRLCGLDEEMSFRLLRMKYKSTDMTPDVDLVLPKESLEKSYYNSNGRLIKTTLSGEFMAHVNQAVTASSRDISADITAINYDDEGLYVDAVLYGCSCLNESSYKVYVNINGERSRVIRSKVYTLKKYFDVPFLKRYSFRFFVPVSKGKNIDTIYLSMKYEKLVFRIGMTFNGIFSKLSTNIKNSYWHFLDRIMTYDRKTRSIVIRRATGSLLGICENKFLSEANKDGTFTDLMYYRQLRKNVSAAISEKTDHKYILFYDDNGVNYNGNLLFRYFSKFKGNEKLEVFFTARRNSDEQDFLLESEYENVLDTGSKKSKITALSSDLIIATDCDVYESLGFTKRDMVFLKDLFNAKIISVKDFFMTYDTAQFDNRLRDNTQLFFCASQIEKEHLLKKIYDYDEAMIKVTGYPLLDTLTDNKEKLILISPGDRRQFCIYEHSEYYRFSESRFFKLYNNILIDPILLEAIRSHGYKIAVLMPHSIEKFIKLFTSSDDITLYEYTEGNEAMLISKASLLITDYCDIQYRFAYLNKPVVYYYPHDLPIQQEYKNEGLAKSSFGELFFEHDSLINYLIREIDKDFRQKPYYSKKCREFFQYHDTDNCKRIIKTLISTFFPELYN